MTQKSSSPFKSKRTRRRKSNLYDKYNYDINTNLDDVKLHKSSFHIKRKNNFIINPTNPNPINNKRDSFPSFFVIDPKLRKSIIKRQIHMDMINMREEEDHDQIPEKDERMNGNEDSEMVLLLDNDDDDEEKRKVKKKVLYRKKKRKCMTSLPKKKIIIITGNSYNGEQVLLKRSQSHEREVNNNNSEEERNKKRKRKSSSRKKKKMVFRENSNLNNENGDDDEFGPWKEQKDISLKDEIECIERELNSIDFSKEEQKYEKNIKKEPVLEIKTPTNLDEDNEDNEEVVKNIVKMLSLSPRQTENLKKILIPIK